jgi:hypothetical protein
MPNTKDQAADVSLAGRAIWQAGGSGPPTFPDGRVCALPGCSTVLSIYNPREACAEHQIARPCPPMTGRPRASEARLLRNFRTLADFMLQGAIPPVPPAPSPPPVPEPSPPKEPPTGEQPEPQVRRHR